MTADLGRNLFGLLCLLCAVVIVTGAWLEIARTRQGNSLLAPRHFRLRLFSALVWMINVLSLAGAVTIWWPLAHASDNQKLQFVSVVKGVVGLTLVGLLLLGVDMWMLASARHKVEREHAVRFAEELRELAEKETMRLRGEQAQNAKISTQTDKKVRAYAPPNDSENSSPNNASLNQ